MGLKLQAVETGAGWRWVSQALREYGRHPLPYTGLFMAFILAVFVAMLLPVVGGVLLIMGVPLLTLGFMMAVEGAQRGQVPGPGIFLEAWQTGSAESRRRLLLLLIAFLVCSTASMWLTEWLDDGAFAAWLQAALGGEASPEEVAALAAAPGAVSGALWRIALTAAVSVPFWFAPALLRWGGQGVAQALFSSTLALWRARAAFLAYFGAWALICLAAGLLGSVLAGIGGSVLVLLLVSPLALMLSSAFYISLYFSFRDCFAEAG